MTAQIQEQFSTAFVRVFVALFVVLKWCPMLQN